MRSATALLLTGALLGVAPATAQAAPAPHSVSHVALSSSKRGGSSSTSGGVSKSGGGVSKKKSRSGGHSSRSTHGGDGVSTGKKMPLWGAILFLLVVGGLLVWSAVRFVRKIRKFFNK
ncbi:hypothetical protein ABZ370_23670 [Streptomyces sp. NPDC005962]|uniref:hypothetical protein n=1 Tax=Streptomyces sp. NPDC005962 TaxID=3154466 RepID=UPI0033E82744